MLPDNITQEDLDKAYKDANIAAKLEYKTLEPELKKLAERIYSLRMLIMHTSNLIGERFEYDEYWPTHKEANVYPDKRWSSQVHRQKHTRY